MSIMVTRAISSVSALIVNIGFVFLLTCRTERFVVTLSYSLTNIQARSLK